MERRAKIMATFGPASNSPEVIARLLDAGVDIVRFNLSHGTHESHKQVLEHVRAAAEERRKHVPVVFDLMGPRYRLGKLSDGKRELAAGDRVSLGEAPESDLPVDTPGLIDYLLPGERILIDNGLVELVVESRKDESIQARVIHGGPVSTRKGINLPDSALPFNISKKDREDIAFAVEVGADFIGASYVGSPKHLERLRGVIEASGGELPLIAKLERAAAVESLEAIVKSADAVMVARGDLGVEVPLYQVPVLQKKIIDAGRRTGTPVIVATQMLESMMQQPRPTRAEVSDVANAVFDGADALMLSGETAAGDFPVEAVETMGRVIHEAESYRRSGDSKTSGPIELYDRAGGRSEDLEDRVPDAVSSAAAHAVESLQVRRIVAFSQGGFTARLMARYRPAVPILAFTSNRQVARRSQLLWGVQPLLLKSQPRHHDEVVQVLDRRLLEEGLAEPDEVIIVLMGVPISERPRTNLMRVHRVRDMPLSEDDDDGLGANAARPPTS